MITNAIISHKEIQRKEGSQEWCNQETSSISLLFSWYLSFLLKLTSLMVTRWLPAIAEVTCFLVHIQPGKKCLFPPVLLNWHESYAFPRIITCTDWLFFRSPSFRANHRHAVTVMSLSKQNHLWTWGTEPASPEFLGLSFDGRTNS